MSKVYFTLAEFEHSDNAIAAGVSNTPTETEKKNIEETIAAISPFREAWGKYVEEKFPGKLQGIKITSGYRNDWVNTKAGGVSTSAHRVGWAADMQPSNGLIDEFIKFATSYWNDQKNKGVKFDQVILEQNARGTKWVHFGLKNQQGLQRGSVFPMKA